MCALHWSRHRGGVPLGKPFASWTRGVVECRVGVCERPAYAHGLCYAHRERERRGYEVDTPIRPTLVSDADKVAMLLRGATRDGDCLRAERIGTDGYATSVKDENGRGIKTHRLVYRVKNGPLKHGFQVHHACGNRWCIEPAHLVLATQRDNVAEMLARLSYERRIAKLEADNRELRARLGMPLEST